MFRVAFERHISRALDDSELTLDVEREYELLVMDACTELAVTDAGKFCIGGFGDPNWTLDLEYDFSAFMEQFPLLLTGIRQMFEVEVDIYSQGVERVLTFSPRNGDVAITCTSRIEWTANPKCELVDRNYLIDMLRLLAVNFAASLGGINSKMANLEPFSRWLKGEV